jgi:DNA polymerase III alpha subunit
MKYNIENGSAIFECGCSFPVEDGKLQFFADTHHSKFNVNLDCLATYESLSRGETEGVFQLTSQLGHSFTKKVRPENIEHVAALGSILRPGCLDSKLEDGKSLTEHYAKRKNNEEDVPTYHPVVDNILKRTYGVLAFQEQSMELAVQCAGFGLQEADSLRKAIGKKIPEEMAKSRKLFLEKAKIEKVLTDEQAIAVFDQIEASQRYGFNASHAVCYGIRGYICSYIKTHFPVEYYKNWLSNEKDRVEFPKLINEAKLFDISVHVPDVRHLKSNFYAIGNKIYFGLGNIKGIKRADIDKLADMWNDATTKSWINFLCEVLENLSSNTVEGLVYSGALDYFGLDREVMWREYTIWNEMTPGQKTGYSKGCKDSLLEILKGINAAIETDFEVKGYEYEEKLAKRAASTRKTKKPPKEILPPNPPKSLEKITKLINMLEHPVYNIQDTIDSVVFHEQDLLGVAITKHPAGSIKNCAETHSCIDIINGFRGYAVLKVKIDRASPYKCKTGDKMCFLELSDETYNLGNVVAFPKVYEEFKHLLVQDNLVFVTGRKDKDSFLIDKAYPIS